MSRPDIAERTIAFSILVIKLSRELTRDDVGRTVGKQLIRSGTSIGANTHEAQAAQTKPDFVTKISIAHKEASETSYWLKVIKRSCLTNSERLDAVVRECEEINRILAAILITAKGKRNNQVL